MRELFKKLGSLALGAGALSLVLANAAMTHGCARSPATQVIPQTGPPGAVAEAPHSRLSAAAGGSAANPDCQPPAYMYATKAPIFVPPGCPGAGPMPEQVRVPGSPANAAQQAQPSDLDEL